jgi:hypothetical protein
MNTLSNRKRWLTVVLFAVAMAWVESAVVLYLRTLTDRIQPHQANPLPVIGSLGPVELVREAATLVMLLLVGILAGQTWRQRLGFASLAFGMWDIFYYVFLRVICGWPESLLDWDILFLLPLPWWGPVVAPVSIATLMVLWGTVAARGWHEGEARGIAWLGGFDIRSWLFGSAGIGLALYVFMADSLRVAGGGVDVVRNEVPNAFNWPLFAVAFVLMFAAIAAEVRELAGLIYQWTKP